MKVYAVIITQVYDYEDLGVICEIFANESDAITFLKNFVEKEWKDYINKMDWLVENDEETLYTACEEFNWTANHVEGYIEEKEINEHPR